MRRYALFALSALLLAAALPARAQDTDRPPEVAERVIAFYNAPGTIHFSGRTRIPAARTVGGDVAVLGGPLLVAGRIEGDVVVLGGDVELLPGAVVTGSLTVVGGAVDRAEGVQVGGAVAWYAEALEVERVGDRLVRVDGEREEAVASRRRAEEEEEAEGRSLLRGGRREKGEGRADFVVATGQSYNRVEGLPITFGPVLETEGSNPTRLRLSAIYRTEEGLALGPDRWGYEARLEQFVGGQRALRVGAALRSVVDPIEAWHLTKLENGLSTFFLHRDYRDHYEREGWSAYATYAPETSPLSLTAEFRSENQNSMASGSPWTLFDNDEPWRPQPLVAEGRLKSAALRAVWDTRSEVDDPSTGWYVQAGVEQTLDTDLRRPEGLLADLPDGSPPVSVPAERFGNFAAAMLDARRYNRISPNSRLNLRVLAGGSLDGSRLPPQRQHALGGEGSLPGYDLFSLDCGARRERVRRVSDVEENRDDLPPPAFHTGYGCDRFALVQAEYRGKLNFRFNWGRDEWDAEEEGLAAGAAPAAERGPFGPREWNVDFGWVVFADAGWGWTLDDAAGRHDEETAVDVGFGLLVGRVGFYGAIPLEGGRGVNVFVRLAPRF